MGQEGESGGKEAGMAAIGTVNVLLLPSSYLALGKPVDESIL